MLSCFLSTPTKKRLKTINLCCFYAQKGQKKRKDVSEDPIFCSVPYGISLPNIYNWYFSLYLLNASSNYIPYVITVSL
jgi:hypothetical protein